MNFINKILAICIITLLCSFNCYATDTSTVSDRQTQFKKLWHELERRNIKLPPWNPNWTEAELKTRFDQIQKDRLVMYLVKPEDFDKKSTDAHWKDLKHILENWKYWKSRYSYPASLLYTRVSSDYNASIVTIDGIDFLAMEGPRARNIKTFLKILAKYRVTDLVRLAPTADHKKKEPIFPYWEGHIDINSVNGNPSIEISGREMNYFSTDRWLNDTGIEPAKLLALIKTVKKSTISEPKMIAVHCRAGTGRTGTFIAGYVLIDEIDKQLASGTDVAHLKISIDKIFWELMLQRPYAIGRFLQYLTLYKLVNYYVKNKSL